MDSPLEAGLPRSGSDPAAKWDLPGDEVGPSSGEVGPSGDEVGGIRW